MFGTATAPTAIAMVGGAIGGEDRLVLAIAGVSAPCALLVAVFFAPAIRGGDARALKPDR